MIKLIVKYADNREDWIEQFPDVDSAQSWIIEEISRPYWKNDNRVQLIDLTPTPPSEKEILADKWKELRNKRDKALTASDWCMLGDAPLNKEQKAIMANYRQALRTLPENSHNPDQLELPEIPKL